MAIKNLETLIALANFGRFFPEGKAFAVTDPSVNPFPNPDTGGMCGATLKPGVDDAGWVPLPNITIFAPSVSDEKMYKKEKPVCTPTGYKLRRERNIRFGEVMGLKFTCDELSPLVHQAFWRTQPLTAAGGVVNPQAGNVPVGWLKFLQEDHAGDSILLADFWVELDVKSGMDANYNDPLKPVIEVTLLHSPLESMLF